MSIFTNHPEECMVYCCCHLCIRDVPMTVPWPPKPGWPEQLLIMEALWISTMSTTKMNFSTTGSPQIGSRLILVSHLSPVLCFWAAGGSFQLNFHVACCTTACSNTAWWRSGYRLHGTTPSFGCRPETGNSQDGDFVRIVNYDAPFIYRILKCLLPQNNSFFIATASVVKDAADDPDCQGLRE